MEEEGSGDGQTVDSRIPQGGEGAAGRWADQCVMEVQCNHLIGQNRNVIAGPLFIILSVMVILLFIYIYIGREVRTSPVS